MTVEEQIQDLYNQLIQAINTLTDQLVNDSCTVRDIQEIKAKIQALTSLISELPDSGSPTNEDCCVPLFGVGNPNTNNVQPDSEWYIDTENNIAYAWENGVWVVKHSFETTAPTFTETDTGFVTFELVGNNLNVTYLSENGPENYVIDFSVYENFLHEVVQFEVVGGNLEYSFARGVGDNQTFSVPLPEQILQNAPSVTQFEKVGNDLVFEFNQGDGNVQTFTIPFQALSEYITSLYEAYLDAQNILHIGYNNESNTNEVFAIDFSRFIQDASVDRFEFNGDTLYFDFLKPDGTIQSFQQVISLDSANLNGLTPGNNIVPEIIPTITDWDNLTDEGKVQAIIDYIDTLNAEIDALNNLHFEAYELIYDNGSLITIQDELDDIRNDPSYNSISFVSVQRLDQGTLVEKQFWQYNQDTSSWEVFFTIPYGKNTTTNKSGFGYIQFNTTTISNTTTTFDINDSSSITSIQGVALESGDLMTCGSAQQLAAGISVINSAGMVIDTVVTTNSVSTVDIRLASLGSVNATVIFQGFLKVT